jgi:hypothetical protein
MSKAPEDFLVLLEALKPIQSQDVVKQLSPPVSLKILRR